MYNSKVKLIYSNHSIILHDNLQKKLPINAKNTVFDAFPAIFQLVVDAYLFKEPFQVVTVARRRALLTTFLRRGRHQSRH